MNKPKMKTELAVFSIDESVRCIWFNATADAAEDAKEFGRVTLFTNSYLLVVDARFDFKEVETYLRNYDNRLS